MAKELFVDDLHRVVLHNEFTRLDRRFRRNSQDGIGFLSTHKPRFAFRAAFSASASRFVLSYFL
jgi:hypothetical protein